jgi:hypothetical protein
LDTDSAPVGEKEIPPGQEYRDRYTEIDEMDRRLDLMFIMSSSGDL